ncbi:DNA-binding transcriptional regulator, GntR family [Nakamurella panacisegetis]|uniref:DNA-binding transcriptional regulator, GntR family n=1 Tax=Nakamurella panacisegetis TaxID=1090615 RepID=A0A1H0ILJ5_9ACTN|nr:GntR family transcriptional regulator [Nakamurella panacisegetis]SDO32160.1 DNA-binding transcriptional regulator, GntR family [Nakamurella panacisegetis]
MTDLFMELDRSSPVPLYFQVSQQIEQAISSGRLGPGARLDNEISLADRFGLSRPTMRRAIQELVDKGLLVRKRGVGTQVVHGQVSRPVELTSLYDDLARANQAPRTTLLVNEIVPASEVVADILDVPVRSQVLRLRRLRFANGEPLAIMENYLPADLSDIGRADLEERGLYQLMRARGVHIRVAKQRIGAKAGTTEECRLLGERRGSPLLTMDRATHDDRGRPVEWGHHAYRASQYSFEVTLVDH